MASRVRGTVVVAVGAVIIAGSVGGYYWATGREAKKQVSLGWGRLAKCLVGEPLHEGEKPSARFHRIELGAAMAPQDAAERSTGVQRWPNRCTVEAQVLYRFLLEAGYAEVGDREKKADVKMANRTFAYWVDEFTAPMALPSNEQERIGLDTLWDEAKKAGLQARPDAAAETPVPPPIPRIEPLTVDALAKEEPLVKTVDSIEFGQAESFDDVLPMLVKKNALDPPLVCLFGEKDASCKKTGAAVPEGGFANFVGGAEGMASPLLVLDGRAARGDTGERLGDLFVDSAWIGADGVVTALAREKRDAPALEIVRQTAGKPPSKRKPIPDDLTGPTLYAGWLVATALRADGPRLVVAKEGPEGLGPLQDLGASRPISRCRTPEATFLATRSYLVMFANGAWSKPIGTSVQGRLTCRGQEATQTVVEGDVIKQERCTASGCTQESVRKNEIWRDGVVGSTLVSDLDGKLFVAWYDRSAVPLAKIAPIKEIKSATPIVLFDPYTQGGMVEDKAADAPSRIFVGNRFALMVVAPPQGVFVMRVLPDGTFSFVKPAGDR